MNGKIRVAALLTTLVCAPIAARQAQPPQFGAGNRTVAVYATVTGARGRLVPDLSREDFAIDDNGKRQELTLFANDIQPITLIMLLDRSGSMKANFDLEERAAEAFVHQMLPGDKARVGSFAKSIQIDPEEFTYCTKGLSGGKDAEEDKVLLQQAYNFSTLVDFVPDLTTTYNNDRQQAIYHTPQARLSSLYGEILKSSKVVSGGLTEPEKAKLEKFRGLLTHPYKYKDPITDVVSDRIEESAMVKQYNEKASAYTDAVLEYNNKRITAAAATGPEGKAAVADWALNAATYRRKVKSAMDAWVSTGFKNDVDQINAYINQVTQRDMMLWKQTLLENYADGVVHSLGSPFYYTSLIPGAFATAKGWTNFSFREYDFASNEHSKSNAWGANASVNFKRWSAAVSATGTTIIRNAGLGSFLRSQVEGVFRIICYRRTMRSKLRIISR